MAHKRFCEGQIVYKADGVAVTIKYYSIEDLAVVICDNLLTGKEEELEEKLLSTDIPQL